MSGWQVVSFYTTGTGYEQEILKLEASLIKFNLPYKFFAYKPTGTWRGNLNYKSETILKAFDLFPDKDIVFLDADAIVRKHPILFDELSGKHKYDLAAHYFRYKPQSGDQDELLSGTLWIQNGSMGKKLIQRWHEIGLNHPEIRHQKCLKLAIQQLQAEGEDIKVYRSPFEYTCIFDYPARQGKEVVIEHFQASRKLRHQVGFGVSLIPGRMNIRKPLSTRDLAKLRRLKIKTRRAT